MQQIKDTDANHRRAVGTACTGLDHSRLRLNVTEGLVAPVVVLSHDRTGYLAKTMMILLK